MFTNNNPRIIGHGISEIVADFEFDEPVSSARLLELEYSNPHFINGIDVIIETIDDSKRPVRTAMGLTAFPSKAKSETDSRQWRIKIGERVVNQVSPGQIFQAIREIPKYISGKDAEVSIRLLELYFDTQGTNPPSLELIADMHCRTTPVEFFHVTSPGEPTSQARPILRFGNPRGEDGNEFRHTQFSPENTSEWQAGKWKSHQRFELEEPVNRTTYAVHSPESARFDVSLSHQIDGGLTNWWAEMTSKWFLPKSVVTGPQEDTEPNAVDDPDSHFWQEVRNLDFTGSSVVCQTSLKKDWASRFEQSFVVAEYALRELALQEEFTDQYDMAIAAISELLERSKHITNWHEIPFVNCFDESCEYDMDGVWGSMFHSPSCKKALKGRSGSQIQDSESDLSDEKPSKQDSSEIYKGVRDRASELLKMSDKQLSEDTRDLLKKLDQDPFDK